MRPRIRRVLRRELEARKLSQRACPRAQELLRRITDILNGKRGVSPETAMRLSRYFGNSARFWLNLKRITNWLPPRGSLASGSRPR